MIVNYFKIAWRNLLKHRFISFINLFGLTVGLTCCILIVIYVANEFSYDKFNNKADRIYRINRSFNNPGGPDILQLSAVAPPTGPLLKNDFPDIQEITRITSNGYTTVKYGDKLFSEKKTYYADENLFDFFNVPILKGNPKTALLEPYSLMLSPEMAKKYFGDEDPMDKLITVDGQFTYKVTGIFHDFPSNSHFHPTVLFSFNTLKDSLVYGQRQLETNWGNNSFYTYLLLPKNYSAAKIESQLPAFIDKNIPLVAGTTTATKQSDLTRMSLQKLTDIHLTSHHDDELEQNGDLKRIYIFMAVALFILLIACINYMNLSTARSMIRAREVGIRKVVGAERKEIIFQFLSESIMITWLALIASVLLTWIFLPYLNSLTNQALSLSVLLNPAMLVSLISIPFVVGCVSGIYPALFMSSFKPIKVLKGILKSNQGGISLRKALVVVQFSISIVLIIATTIVFQQLNYMQKASLGYDRDHVINVPYTSVLTPQFETFRNEILKTSGIKSIGRSSRVPTNRLLDNSNLRVMQGDSLQPLNVDLKSVTVDYDFIPTYNIEVIAGRNFSRDFSTDTNNYVINEAAMKVLNYKSFDEATGKDIEYNGVRGKIIGIVKDFHFESMHQKIIPIIMSMPTFGNGLFRAISIKVNGADVSAAIANVRQVWSKFAPESPFTYTFLDDSYGKLYESEQRQGTLFTIFACIAIFIASLGLFGLSAFSITQRIKEIGIRKVLGASAGTIVRLLSIDFMKLVMIAALIAFPIAWFAMHTWLQDFAYRINISWVVFIIAALVAAIIALATISLQALRAAFSNPVKSLKAE